MNGAILENYVVSEIAKTYFFFFFFLFSNTLR